MAETFKQILRYGLQANYNASTADSDLLYFTEQGKLYKGGIDYTNAFISTASVSTASTGLAGKIYLAADTNQAMTYVGNAWKVLGNPTTGEIDGLDPSDVKVPTEAAVVAYVSGAIAGDDVVKSISQKMTTVTDPDTSEPVEVPVVGTFKYVTGDTTSHDVQLTGLSGTPTWNPTTRELVIPVVGGTAVTATIGKDIYIDPTAQNGYNPQTNTIDIYLNDGDATHDPTLIAIPVEQLVEDYIGEDTATVDLNIDANHVVTANVKLSTVATNALSTQADGLYLDLSAYATTSSVNDRFTNVESTVSGLVTTTSNLSTAVTLLMDASSVSGSVDYKILNATTASCLLLNDHEERLQAIEAALGWGTF